MANWGSRGLCPGGTSVSEGGDIRSTVGRLQGERWMWAKEHLAENSGHVIFFNYVTEAL
jgi:hypothetical protein